MARGEIKISIYQPPAFPAAAPKPYRFTRPQAQPLWDDPRRWTAALIAGAGTLLLHLMFIAAANWGMGAGKPKTITPPVTRLPGGRAGKDGTTMEWILIQDQDVQRGSGTPRPMQDLEPPTQPIRLEQPPVPDIAVEGEETQAQANAASPQAGSSDLFGLYMHQVDARIERAWLRPRTSIGARQFSCSARIKQDEGGHVLDVQLRRCNGDAHWQQSLLEAIHLASPLPFAPDPKVFKPVITLTFQAKPFSSASEPELYEPLERSASSSTAPITQNH